MVQRQNCAEERTRARAHTDEKVRQGENQASKRASKVVWGSGTGEEQSDSQAGWPTSKPKAGC